MRLSRSKQRVAVALMGVVVLAGVLAAVLSGSSPRGHRVSSRSQCASAATAPAPPHTVAADQLSVAEELGPDIVAAWVTHVGSGLCVQVYTLTGLEQPTPVPLTLLHAAITGRCGVGCATTRLPGTAGTLAVRAEIGGVRYAARLPVAFVAGGAHRADALVERMDAAQARLRTAAIHESLASSPAPADITDYQVEAPDRMAYRLTRAGRFVADTVIVGTREWNRYSEAARWQATSYGSTPFSAAAYLDWWASYESNLRLLDLRRTASGTVADVAALNEVAGLGPVWFRFHIDVAHDRLLSLRMTTADHFMSQSWSDFDAPQAIAPPSGGEAAPAG